MKRKNHERIFLRDLSKSWNEKPNAYFYKIPDSGNPFMRQRPFDAVAGESGVCYAIEAKFSRSKPNMKLLKPHQLEGLEKAMASGFVALMIVKTAIPRHAEVWSIRLKSKCGQLLRDKGKWQIFWDVAP